jgi:hypothetical protein
MRSLGVTKVDVYCGCGHEVSVDVSDLPCDLVVADVRLRLRSRNAASDRPKLGPIGQPAGFAADCSGSITGDDRSSRIYCNGICARRDHQILDRILQEYVVMTDLSACSATIGGRLPAPTA